MANGFPQFENFDNLSPIVNTKNCFDDLRVSIDHDSRKKTNTYYIDDEQVISFL